MITCLGDVLFPSVGEATVKLLRRLGVDVDFPDVQTCCGQPHFNSGHHDEARRLARHTINAFEGDRIIIVPSGSCAAMVKVEFPELFKDDPKWGPRARELSSRTHEISDYLVNVLGLEDVGARYPGKATYHMACHLRVLEGNGEPERLLRHVRDLEFVPMERLDECCGFGGSFSVRFPAVSGTMVRDKVQAIEQTGADVVVSTDAGCLMNIAGALRRRGSKVRTKHIAEILACSSEGY